MSISSHLPPSHTNDDDDNKRQYVRLARSYHVHARELAFPRPTEPLVDCGCCDISRGGVCVSARRMAEKGTRLEVRVHIPLLNKYSSRFFKVYENDADQYFTAIGEVAWVRGREIGITFVNAEEDLLRALGKLVDAALQGR